MSTIAPLAAFCAAMAALAVGKAVRAETRDLLEIGSATLLLGITGLVLAWLSIRYGWPRTIGAPLLVGGAILSGIGVVLIARNL